MQGSNEFEKPVKDETTAHPVARVWRPILREIVRALAQGDYSLASLNHSVKPVSAATAKQVREYLAGYGETLAEIHDEAWNSSVSQWMGIYWDVLVDLWTAESGESDMVLSVRIFEEGNGFRIDLVSVHVP